MKYLIATLGVFLIVTNVQMVQVSRLRSHLIEANQRWNDAEQEGIKFRTAYYYLVAQLQTNVTTHVFYHGLEITNQTIVVHTTTVSN